MVIAIEPRLVPSLERGFQREGKKKMVRAGLDPHATHHLVFGSTGLIL
jgi:hypothetical protein